MDARLKNILDNYEKMKIGADELFKFHCTMCGKCCINREDILLTPRDVYNMAKQLSMSPEDLIRQYCEVYIGADSRFPIVRLKPQGNNKRCPLLRHDRCRVHNAKPAVCAMFPIGRALGAVEAGDKLPQFTVSDIQYLFTDPGCGDDAETHTPREWMESFGLPVPDTYFIKWQQLLCQTSLWLRKFEKEATEQTMEIIWTAIHIGLYLKYDMNKDFMEQFERNAQEIVALMRQAIFDEDGDNHE